MGLSNREGGKYITILGGKFSVRTNKENPEAIERVNKVGNTVYEVFYDSFTGKIVNIRTRDGEYGKSWEFDFQDGGEIYTLQLSYSNSYATNILKMLPNIDLSKEMKVQPSQKMEDGKTKSSLFISQDGVTLKHAYTMAEPNGLPPMVQIVVKGQTVWDDTERLAFLQEMVDRDIIPQLEGATKSRVDETPKTGLEGEFDNDNPLGGEDNDF